MWYDDGREHAMGWGEESGRGAEPTDGNCQVEALQISFCYMSLVENTFTLHMSPQTTIANVKCFVLCIDICVVWATLDCAVSGARFRRSRTSTLGRGIGIELK